MTRPNGVRGTNIDTVGVLAALKRVFAVPTKSLEKKKGRGSYRRSFHHVPLKTISRRYQKAKTLKGSKKIHQFLDIGHEGKLLISERPCHRCPGCMALDAEKIIKDCENKDRCGQARITAVQPLSGASAELPLLRSAPAQAGKKMALEGEEGDFIAIELTHCVNPWTMAEIVVEAYEFDEPELVGGSNWAISLLTPASGCPWSMVAAATRSSKPTRWCVSLLRTFATSSRRVS